MLIREVLKQRKIKTENKLKANKMVQNVQTCEAILCSYFYQVTGTQIAAIHTLAHVPALLAHTDFRLHHSVIIGEDH